MVFESNLLSITPLNNNRNVLIEKENQFFFSTLERIDFKSLNTKFFLGESFMLCSSHDCINVFFFFNSTGIKFFMSFFFFDSNLEMRMSATSILIFFLEKDNLIIWW